MNIGNKIYISSEKKTYRKPVLEVVDIDRGIVLMGNSDVIPDPLGFVQSNPESTETTNERKKMFPESEDPFGGGTPDYER